MGREVQIVGEQWNHSQLAMHYYCLDHGGRYLTTNGTRYIAWKSCNTSIVIPFTSDCKQTCNTWHLERYIERKATGDIQKCSFSANGELQADTRQYLSIQGGGLALSRGQETSGGGSIGFGWTAQFQWGQPGHGETFASSGQLCDRDSHDKDANCLTFPDGWNGGDFVDPLVTGPSEVAFCWAWEIE